MGAMPLGHLTFMEAGPLALLLVLAFFAGVAAGRLGSRRRRSS